MQREDAFWAEFRLPPRWGRTWEFGPQVKILALGLEWGAGPKELPVSRQMAETEAVKLKEEGNQHFQLQDYKAAAKSYSQALKLTKDKALLATLYRNRAACGLKTVWSWVGRWGRVGRLWGRRPWGGRQPLNLATIPAVPHWIPSVETHHAVSLERQKPMQVCLRFGRCFPWVS